MQLEHSFTVPVGVDEAWNVLTDIERVAPCMPGAALDSVEGDDFTGTVKVRLGPIGLTYKGRASFVEKDAAARRAVINARGRDARGNGTATARVTATLTEVGDETKVDVRTDLDITGKPAQFGRGVMADVGNKLIGQFANCLATKLSGDGAAPAEQPPSEQTGDSAPAAEPAAEPAPDTASAAVAAAAAAVETEVRTAPAPEPSDAAPGMPADAAPGMPADAAPPHRAPWRTPEVEPINLIEHAGPAVLKRAAPAVGALVIVALVIRLIRRR